MIPPDACDRPQWKRIGSLKIGQRINLNVTNKIGFASSTTYNYYGAEGCILCPQVGALNNDYAALSALVQLRTEGYVYERPIREFASFTAPFSGLLFVGVNTWVNPTSTVRFAGSFSITSSIH